MLRPLLLATAASLASLPAVADDYNAAMQSYLDEQISAWAQDAQIVEAILATNAAHAGLDAAAIDAMDQTWRAEIGSGQTPTIDPVLTGALADMLRAQVEASGGAITEIFVMDSLGLNVAASHVTSDYWQGDEAKHQETYGVGPGAVHFGEIEFDESSQRYQSQISFTVVDPADGSAIGAITVGVDAEALL